MSVSHEALLIAYLSFNFLLTGVISAIWFHYEFFKKKLKKTNNGENEGNCSDNIVKLNTNKKFSNYFYQITINGGLQKCLKDDVNVYVKLIGSENDGTVHCLKKASSTHNEHNSLTNNGIALFLFKTIKNIFQKKSFIKIGETKSFLVNEANSLGNVDAINLWFQVDNNNDNDDFKRHASEQTRNNGKKFLFEINDQSFRNWYLNYIIVYDIQNKKKYYFLIYNWVILNKRHTQCSILCKQAANIDLENFGHNFLTNFIQIAIYDNIFLSFLLPKSTYSYVPMHVKLVFIALLNTINMVLTAYNTQCITSINQYKQQQDPFYVFAITAEFLINIILFLLYNFLIKKFYFLNWFYQTNEKCDSNILFKDFFIKSVNRTFDNVDDKLMYCVNILSNLQQDFASFNKFREHCCNYMLNTDFENVEDDDTFNNQNTFLVCIYHFGFFIFNLII